MTISAPSRRIVVADIVEPENFKAEFSYNYFTADERINSNGSVSNELLERPSESFDSNFINAAITKIPRFVRFTWKPVIENQKDYIVNKISIKKYYKKIHNEESFATDEYTNIDFQDNGLDNKLSLYIEQASNNIELNKQPKKYNSPNDVVKSLNKKTSGEVQEDYLINSFSDLSRYGIFFVDPEANKITNDVNTLTKFKELKSSIKINNKIIKDLLQSCVDDGVGIHVDEVFSLLKEASTIQEKSITSKNSSILDSLDYDFEILDYINYRNVDTDGFDPTVQIIGYIIEKQEVLSDGTIIDKESIIVENPFSSTTIDIKVKYGSTYIYKIKSVAYIETQADDKDSNSVVAVSFLLSSRLSVKNVVNCIEQVPPPPPADFNIGWDYMQRCVRLMWSLPPNSQRDIKKFQIFRRKTIYEPFQLIKMYDFDDSLVKSPYYEFPDPNIIEITTSPQTSYLDKEFTKESKYIYAICSIDAHGLSSNYSIQYEISFNKITNKIIKKLVSSSGAPKSYPNSYLEQDTFVDLIKDSNHKKLSIYFAPEYLKIINNKGDDLKIIKTNEDNSLYKIQMINVDLQTQKTINISLNDRRTSKQKERK